MKSKLPLLIVIAILCSFSCKKSKEMPAEKLPVKLLTRTIQVEKGSTSFTNYTYDDQHRLKTIKETYGIQNYTYDGTVLSAIEYTYPSTTKIILSFTDGKPIKAVTTYPDKTITSGYIYIGDQVSEIHDTQSGVVVNLEKYSYVNHNIVNIISDFGQGIFIEDIIYGSHKNMFSNSSLKYVIGVEYIDRYSENEVLESTISYPNGTTLTKKNTYAYDSEGYPITLISTFTNSSGQKVGEARYTFEYEIS